jgi:nitrate/nitrite transport system permease protein
MGTLSQNKKAAILSILMLIGGLLIWELSIPAQKAATELTEY